MQHKRRIYLDFNATTPVDPAVVEVMLPYFREQFGNPSSLHVEGQRAAAALDRARLQTARLIGARADEIVFTSGATEANNMALTGALAARRAQGRDHLIISSVEHSSVAAPADWLETQGWRVTRVPSDGRGQLEPGVLEAALDDRTALVSLILGNNETGTVMDLAGVAELLEARKVWLHLDAVQAAGKIPVNVGRLKVDLLSMSAHKIYGPKGIGALFVRRSIAPWPLVRGGGQEENRRSGTQNVPAIVGMGKACELAAERLMEYGGDCSRLRDRLEQRLLALIPEIQVNGDREARLPNTLNISFKGLDAGMLATRLDMAGVAVSVGSACSNGRSGDARVLQAMGLTREAAVGAMRFSLGRGLTESDIDEAAERLAAIVAACRSADQANQVIDLEVLNGKDH